MHIKQNKPLSKKEVRAIILDHIEEESLYEGTNFPRVVSRLTNAGYRSNSEKSLLNEIQNVIRDLVRDGKVIVEFNDHGNWTHNGDVETSFVNPNYFYSPTRSISTLDFD